MKISRHVALVTGLIALLYSAVAIAAGAAAPFSQSAFDAANKAGQPVLVEVYAPWCPTCRAQGPILKELRAQARFKNLQAFTVDFDNQKDALRMLKAQSQSTLIVFKGGKEVGRSTGDTRKESIEALLAKAL
jgi:thioredoxin-like negative regulator of GroEL